MTALGDVKQLQMMQKRKAQADREARRPAARGARVSPHAEDVAACRRRHLRRRARGACRACGPIHEVRPDLGQFVADIARDAVPHSARLLRRPVPDARDLGHDARQPAGDGARDRGAARREAAGARARARAHERRAPRPADRSRVRDDGRASSSFRRRRPRSKAWSSRSNTSRSWRRRRSSWASWAPTASSATSRCSPRPGPRSSTRSTRSRPSTTTPTCSASNPKIVRADDAAAELTQAKQAAAQAQAQSAQFKETAQSAQALGATPMDGDTALTRLVDQVQQGQAAPAA